jgi:ABC-type oligopeptide transport system ATPase subunit
MPHCEGATPILEARGLRLQLADRAGSRWFRRAPRLEILRGIDLDVARGEAIGVVGESGSGKTTLGRTLLRLYEPTGGSLRFEGQDITHVGEEQLRPMRARMQCVFQDPLSSLNPRHRIEDIVAQPLLSFGLVRDRTEARGRARQLLERVHLSASFAMRYPHELSGGQRQRVGIARAIAASPKLVIADEIVSGLDVSTQAQILMLLREIRAETALVFISHDLSVVRALCDRVVVMHRGVVVEQGATEDVFARPEHAYTRELLASIPLPERDANWIGTA